MLDDVFFVLTRGRSFLSSPTKFSAVGFHKTLRQELLPSSVNRMAEDHRIFSPGDEFEPELSPQVGKLHLCRSSSPRHLPTPTISSARPSSHAPAEPELQLRTRHSQTIRSAIIAGPRAPPTSKHSVSSGEVLSSPPPPAKSSCTDLLPFGIGRPPVVDHLLGLSPSVGSKLRARRLRLPSPNSMLVGSDLRLRAPGPPSPSSPISELLGSERLSEVLGSDKHLGPDRQAPRFPGRVFRSRSTSTTNQEERPRELVPVSS